MKFGDKVRELRTAREMTQQELADKAGVPVGTFRNLEQGSRSPSWHNVVRIARALGVTSAEFDHCDEVKEQPEEKAKKKTK